MFKLLSHTSHSIRFSIEILLSNIFTENRLNAVAGYAVLVVLVPNAVAAAASVKTNSSNMKNRKGKKLSTGLSIS